MAATKGGSQASPKGRDLDGDGIPNRIDPDLDGDGVPNGRDRNVDGGVCKKGLLKGRYIGDRLLKGHPAEKDFDDDWLFDDSPREKDLDGDGRLDHDDDEDDDLNDD